MPKRISKVAQEYAQRQIGVGETFDVEPQDVALLLTLDRIEPETKDETAAEAAPYLTRDLAAQRVKRPYNRKSV